MNHGKGTSVAAGHLREVTEDDIREAEAATAERSRMSSGGNAKNHAASSSEARRRTNRGQLEELEAFD